VSLEPGRLCPVQRTADLARMAAETFDVLVVGGGVTGAGVALDAATRGLSVALVEQRDLASGTSSRSSKLFHGGLRYLEQLDFGLVSEALHERNLMLDRLCPHLARPVRFLYPLTHHVWERAYVGAGIALYDVLAAAGGSRLPRHRHLSRRGARRLVPSLRGDAITGAITYSDAQVDDARHTLAVARTAHQHGAAVASSAQVVELRRDDGRVVGARVRDVESGDVIDVRARQVVNATGVWTDHVEDLAGTGGLRVRASKGVHLLVPRDRIDAGCGLICRTPSSVLFVIPWGEHWIVGTTDTDWELDLAHPAASAADLDYLLGQANRWLDPSLTHADIVGVYAGLRPLLSGESDSTSTLSREHAVSTAVPGLVSVAGGKYTTYRVMAADAVDAAVAAAGIEAPASCTERIPLVGAPGYEGLRNRRHQLADDAALPLEDVERLLGRYGTEVHRLLDLVAEEPALARPLPGTARVLAVEARYAATHEGALHLDDLLTRRTRLSIESVDRGVAAAPVVARLVADDLGWDEATIEREVDSYRRRVEAERESQRAVDDHTADARRLGADDVRRGLD
jgi:glycerol-3-phosphate dehydrogenase